MGEGRTMQEQLSRATPGAKAEGEYVLQCSGFFVSSCLRGNKSFLIHTMSQTKHRPIRSFVKREGRMTQAQQRALEKLLPLYGVTDIDRPIDLDTLFPRRAPRYLEIGFGMGTSLIKMAEDNPANDYLGIEVHRPGVGSVLIKAEEKQLQNIKLINHDAIAVLKQAIPDNSLDGIYLFFPDPWPKKKHHKRRIVQQGFVEHVYRCLKPGGILHMATDWEDYALSMLQVMAGETGFINTAGADQYAARGQRPETKYECRGLRLGHGVWDLVFRKNNQAIMNS
jgi:tRNA (guanine-N7-)-methyltransferase